MNPETMIQTTIEGRSCLLYASPNPALLLIQVTARHERPTIDAEVAQIAACSPVGVVFAAVELTDWVGQLMPWADDAVMRHATEPPRAADTLSYITNGLLPWLRSHYGPLPCVLGGYSLGGLFALWASYQSADFCGVAAASPSVWIKGWTAYTHQHTLHARHVYLSLGDREEHARNQRMAAVGPCIRDQYQWLSRQMDGGRVVLEWNPGGHFGHEADRTARAFAWICARQAGHGDEMGQK